MRYFLEISYDGTEYCGFQRQENQPSVQQEIEHALSALCKSNIAVIAAGRTDTGVHALQSFVHFDTENTIDHHFLYHLNAILSKNICAKNIYEVQPNTHARFDATERSYTYKIHFQKNPFLFPFSFQFSFAKLDFERMNLACEILKKYNDFEVFSKTGGNNKTTICHITEAFWVHTDTEATFHISANRFLRGMVRLIVGALLNVGLGTISLETFEHHIQHKQKFKRNKSAPAKGLYLSRVIYPNSVFIKPPPIDHFQEIQR